MSYAFLSSPVLGLSDIRTAIHQIELPDGDTIWVDEIDRYRLLENPWNVTLDVLFRRIREADLFLILLGTDRHGSRLNIDGQAAHVTYWEAELFYATLLRKHVQVFELEGFEPGAKLAALLIMLRNVLPRASWAGPYSRERIVTAVHQFVSARRRRKTSPNTAPYDLLPGVVDGFYSLRGKDVRGGFAEEESVPFLDGSFRDPTVTTNERIITTLLDEIRDIRNEEERLSRLWIAFRELSGAPFTDRQYSGLLPLWNRFLGEWASAGSWYGLHGHPHLSVFPALVAQTKVRRHMRRVAAHDDEATIYPGGALASSRYSIATRSASRRVRRKLLRAALDDVNRSIEDGVQNRANLLAIRGSVYLRLEAMNEAIDDYWTVVRRREKTAAPDSAIGEALSELGYAYTLHGRQRVGISLLEEGVRLITSKAVRAGFTARAVRKLGAAYFARGDFDRAQEMSRLQEAYAKQHGVWDQISARIAG